MPTYTFTCSNCAYEFDQRLREMIPAMSCPVCGDVAARHTVYASAFRMGQMPPPQGDVERPNYEKKELKKRGWDGDRAVEAVRKGKVEGEKGLYGMDFEKARKAGA